MKTFNKLAITALCTVILGCTSQQEPTQNNVTTQVQAQKPEYLFFLHAQNGYVSQDKKLSAYYLTLKNPIIMTFTDRPYHKKQEITVKQFMDLWKSKMPNSFSIDNPNAVLVGAIPDKQLSYSQQPFANKIVELNSATLNDKGEIIFKMRVLKLGDQIPTGNYTYTSLIVDDEEIGTW